MITSQALAAAQRNYDRTEPFDFFDSPVPQGFFAQMDLLHEQIEADSRAGQDISTAFVEEMFDAADDNVLMFRAMDKTFSNESIGAYVRELMGRVAKQRI